MLVVILCKPPRAERQLLRAGVRGRQPPENFFEVFCILRHPHLGGVQIQFFISPNLAQLRPQVPA